MDAAVEMVGTLNVLPETELRRLARNVKYMTPDVPEEPVGNDITKSNSILDSVFRTAEARSITIPHRVAAWNTLCALLDQIFRPGDHINYAPGSRDAIWNRGFDLYLNFGQNARPKSAKQLLSTLSTVLRTDDRCDPLRQKAANQLIRNVSTDTHPQVAKSSLRALELFLSKRALSLDEVLHHLPSIGAGSEVSHRTRLENFLILLLSWIGRGDFGSVVGHVLSVVLECQTVQTTGEIIEVSNDLTEDIGSICMASLERVMGLNIVNVDDLRTHILPVLFKQNIAEYRRFLDELGFANLASKTMSLSSKDVGNNENKAELLYAALQAGKELGLLSETEDSEVSETDLCIFLPTRLIHRLLSQYSRRARLTGLSLLITSPSATRPFPRLALDLLKRHLDTCFADTDANFRGEVFSLMQKLLDRFRAITAVLARKTGDPSAVTGLHNHRSFLQWLLSFLSAELRPTASYQRHISALKALSIVSRSGLDCDVSKEHLSKSAVAETKWPFHLQIMNVGTRRLLFDLLLNPFDDVRQTSALILQLHNHSPVGVQDGVQDGVWCEEIQKTIERAEQLMLLTGRADQADGVAHLYTLLYRQQCKQPADSAHKDSPAQVVFTKLLGQVERMLSIAKTDLFTAVSKYPLHGLLTSLRYILLQQCSRKDLECFAPRLITSLHEVWEVVIPVLCNDAPEGFQPDEMDESADFSTKDTLSYCWRALKESSLLLDAIISQLYLDNEALLSLGDLCFRQLAELRHRGAFSTVAQTWILCCIKCSSLSALSGENALRQWFDRILDLLSNRSTINTRRSAGIPALLCGLLIADKTGLLFQQAFKDLAAISSRPVNNLTLESSSLPQVHALNCIKDILKSTRLGERSEPYVPSSLRIAAESLRSEAWGIRNCGLMLFRAVIDRLLGTSEAHLDSDISTSSKLSTHDHPDLLIVVLDLLSSPDADPQGEVSGHGEGVFPALQLLQRLNLPESSLGAASDAVLSLTASRSWHIRDKAARTYARMVPPHEIELKILERLQAAQICNRGQDSLHGDLLCIKYLIAMLEIHETAHESHELATEEHAPARWPAAVFGATDLYRDHICMFTRAAYVDALTESMRFAQRRSKEHLAVADIGRLTKAHFDVRAELRHILQSEHQVAENFTIRRALARALAHTLFLDDSDSEDDIREIVSLILLLGRTDADACHSFFELLSADPTVLTKSASRALQVVFRASAAVLENDVQLKLKIAVQHLLLDLADRQSTPENFGAYLDTRNQTALTSADCNQEYADGWLQLRAIAFDHRFRSTLAIDMAIESDLVSWIEDCCRAVRGTGLFTREAAAQAIYRLDLSWQYIASDQRAPLCDLCLCIYDLLNDDEEDIRSLASATTARIISLNDVHSQAMTLEPIRATERLAKWMVERWSDYPYFVEQAVFRAFGVSKSECVGVTERLASLETTDSALFAEEKQNLYIDDAREVKFWSVVVSNVNSKAIPGYLVDRLSEWVPEGLDALTSKAAMQHDGALGWTSKGEVFSLGLQVIYGVEALLRIAEQGMRIPIRPSDLRLKLGKLQVAAAASDINGLWLREIERVASWAMRASLRRHGTVLEDVLRGTN